MARKFTIKSTFNARRLHHKWRSSLIHDFQRLGDEHVRLRNLVTRTWQEAEDRPTFTRVVTVEPRRIRLRVIMEAEAAEQATLSVWQLLNRGTSVRYMHLSSDWESKTTPHSLISGHGAGHKRGLGGPRPGIEARQFDETANAVLRVVLDDIIFKHGGRLTKIKS